MAQEGICIAAEDTGGNYARTMLLDLATGDVIVRTVGRPELPSIARAFIYGGVTICDMPVYRKKERRSWSKMKKKGFF